MNVRSALCPFAVFLSLAVCAAGAPAGTMTAYPAEDYPSVTSAIDGLAQPAATALSAHADAEARRIAVTGPAAAEHLRRAGEAVLKHLPGGRYTLADSPQAADASRSSSQSDEPVVEVDVKELGRSPVAWQAEPAGHGTVSLTVISGGARRSFSARYQDKPWADDFAAFANANPGRGWVVGRAARPWASQAEASADALSAAADALAPVLRGQLKSDARRQARDDHRLRQFLKEELQTGRLVVDRFSQRFARPYGDVWNEAVLVNAAPDKLKSAAERYARETRGREVHKARALAAGGGLVAVLSVLYLCLNAVTKGYFTWRLRAVTLVLAVAGMFVLARIA